MSKTRIRRPASDTRCARRSLVELTAAASRAVDDDELVTSATLIAASPDDPPRSEHAATLSDRTVGARQGTDPTPVAVAEFLDAAVAPHRRDVREDCQGLSEQRF